MTTNENEPTPAPLSVFAALTNARRKIGHVAKERRNTQGSGYNFRGVDDVVNAAAGPFIEEGLNLIPSRTVIECTDVLSGSKRTEMRRTGVVQTYTLHGPRGDAIMVEVPGEAFDSGDKATPKAMSVAYRTALLQLLMLPTDDPDPDSVTYGQDEVTERQGPTPAQLAYEAARDRAWKVTEGAGNSQQRLELVDAKLAALDPPASRENATTGAWTAVAVSLELNGFTPPATNAAPNGEHAQDEIQERF